MRTGSLKCSLAVFLFACLACFAYSGNATSAVSSAGAFGGTGSFPGIQDGHKEIRSYDSTGFSYDNDADRGAKSYSTPSGHGAGHDHSIKGGSHDYNRNGDGCSKCKWENDDYWEQNEPEEEQNEDECDDGDDGQYRPDKTHHHDGSGRGQVPGSHSYQSGVHKQEPTGVYTDDGVNAGVKGDRPGNINYPTTSERPGSNIDFGGSTLKPGWDTPFASKPGYSSGGVNAGVKGGRPGGINYPTTSERPGSNIGFGGSTSKPGWDTPFASKPGYSSAASTSGITSSSWPSWNTGTTPGNFGSSPKPAWNNEYGTTVGSFVTPRPGTNWNIGSAGKPGQGWNTGPDSIPTTGFPSSRRLAPGWNAHDNKPSGNFGSTPIPGSNWNTDGFSSTSTVGLPSSQKPGAPWTGHDDGRTTPRPGQSWNTGFGGKPGANPWNPNYGAAPVGQSGCTQPDLSCNQGKQGPVKVGATPIGPTKTDEYPSGVFPATSHTGSNIPSGSYGSPKQDQYGPYGQPGTQSVTSGIGSTSQPGRVPDFGRKDHPFGFDQMPTYSQVPHNNKPYIGGADQAYPNTGTYGPGNIPDYSKLGHGSESHNIWPSNVATFGSTKGPYEGISSPTAVPGAQGVTTPSYGSTTTYSWSTPGQIGSGSNSWHGPGSTGPHAGFPTSNTRFPTTKTPFSYGSTSSSIFTGSPYAGTGPKQPGFNIASSSAIANAGASAFATSFGTHNNPSFGTTLYGTTLAPERDTSYPGVKGSPGGIRPSYGITPYGTHPNIGNAWSDKRPDTDGSGTSPRYPETVGSTWPTGQPGTNNEPRGKPGDGSNIMPGRYPGNNGGIWPSGKPGSTSGTTFGGHPGTTDNTWPTRQPGSGLWSTEKPIGGSNVTPGRYPGSISGTTPGYFGTGSGNRPIEQSPSGSGTWPDGQSKYESGSGCSSVTCGGSTGLIGGSSNCGSGNYNCGSSCNEGNYVPTVHGPCGASGPSGVNKTYYPVGTGDGNVPNLGNIYRSNSPPNIGTGTYPGTGCGSGDNSCNQVGGANVVPEESVKWNPANPFLFGPDGGTPSDVSRFWDSGITVKPLGKGNPFFDSSWSTPKLDYNANDKNVIPLGGGNNKPIDQGNPFLDKPRGDINVNEGVISLDGKKPEGSNPFIRPGSNTSNSPSYGQHPIGSGILQSGSSGDRNDGFHPGGIPSQGGSNTGPYSTGGNSPGPLQCKLGVFGCGTPGSGSYAATKDGKYPGGSFDGIGGNAGISGGSPASGANVYGGFANPAGIGSGPVPDHFDNGVGHLGSAGNSGAHAGTYAGSFAQASSFANAKSLSSSDTAGIGNNFGQSYGGSSSSSGAQNPLGGSNSWASSGASAFASSSSGSWSGNRPTDVKG